MHAIHPLHGVHGFLFPSIDNAFIGVQFNFELQDQHRESVVKTVVPLRLNYSLCLLKDDYRPLRLPLPDLEQRYRTPVVACRLCSTGSGAFFVLHLRITAIVISHLENIFSHPTTRPVLGRLERLDPTLNNTCASPSRITLRKLFHYASLLKPSGITYRNKAFP